MKRVTLEVCVATIESVLAAREGGADRIELCAALSEDGITPSYGMMTMARKLGPRRMHVIIRPRGGDFVYSSQEVECMLSDIRAARQAGADGVVIGALTADGDIDIPTCRRLMAAAEGIQVTFHRAFDYCRNPRQALENIISLGCHRLLTSGQAKTAMDGIPMIQSLVRQANGRIIIMPGAGVTSDNARTILNATGATEIHGTFRSMTPHGPETDRRVVECVRFNVES